MKHLLRIACIVSLGLVVTACDKCGNWNFNKPNLCNGVDPRGT